MKKIMWIASCLAALFLGGALILLPGGTVDASPNPQMTPAVDPMSVATVTAPTPQPGNILTDPSTATSTMGTCPMMNGSMTGMSGMSGMGGMQGMSGMGQMGNMAGMGGMQMSGMPMVNDGLSTLAQSGWFYALNPWQLMGWVFLFGLLLLVLVLLVVGVIWLVRQTRRDHPAPTG